MIDFKLQNFKRNQPKSWQWKQKNENQNKDGVMPKIAQK